MMVFMSRYEWILEYYYLILRHVDKQCPTEIERNTNCNLIDSYRSNRTISDMITQTCGTPICTRIDPISHINLL